jgi:hypothetical protein
VGFFTHVRAEPHSTIFDMKNLAEPDVRRAVIERIAKLHSGSKARWGRMSAHQMLCHLTDSYRVPMGEKDASSATSPLQRTLIKWAALNLPMHWPKGVPTRPEMRASEWQRWGYLHADHHLRQFGV